MLSRRRGQDIPGPERGNLFLTKDAVELSSRCGDLIPRQYCRPTRCPGMPAPTPHSLQVAEGEDLT